MYLKLDIISGPNGGIVFAPGNEPPSDMTSLVLLAEMKGRKCFVPVKKALSAIPGSYVETGVNWCGPYQGVRKQWLVLPVHDLKCCNQIPDYYKLLRELAVDQEIEEERTECCDVLGRWDPNPGWNKEREREEPESDPYLPEDNGMYGSGGITPIVPPWRDRFQG
jgi:hypothetical protein